MPQKNLLRSVSHSLRMRAARGEPVASRCHCSSSLTAASWKSPRLVSVMGKTSSESLLTLSRVVPSASYW
ncbi:hypothetical protein ACFPRL_01775 [Pseudoclavibacter helvolus]